MAQTGGNWGETPWGRCFSRRERGVSWSSGPRVPASRRPRRVFTGEPGRRSVQLRVQERLYPAQAAACQEARAQPAACSGGLGSVQHAESTRLLLPRLQLLSQVYRAREATCYLRPLSPEPPGASAAAGVGAGVSLPLAHVTGRWGCS